MSVLLEMLADEPLLFLGAFLISPLGFLVIAANLARTADRYRRKRTQRELKAYLKRERRKERI